MLSFPNQNFISVLLVEMLHVNVRVRIRTNSNPTPNRKGKDRGESQRREIALSSAIPLVNWQSASNGPDGERRTG